MKMALVILTVVLIFMGVIYYQSTESSRQSSADQSRALQNARSELATTLNQAKSMQLHMAAVQTQLLAQVADLQQSIDKVNTEKKQHEQMAVELQGRLEIAEKGLIDEKSRLAVVEDRRQIVAAKLNEVRSLLDDARHQYAELEKTHLATVSDLDALKSRGVTALEEERNSLDRQLNDLDTLRAQIKVVKRRIWDEHVAEWKKQDAAAGAGGNSGLLLKDGQWRTTSLKPSS